MINSESKADELLSCPSIRVHAVIWNALTGLSLGYALTELLDNMPVGHTERTLWCLRDDPQSPRTYYRPALPNLLFRALCKARLSMAAQGQLGSVVALREIERGDIVYMWPPYNLMMIKHARNRGAIVVAERTNCMGEMYRDVLTRAYARRGLPLPPGSCTSQMIAEERQQVLACNFVTAPNRFVSQSLRDAGVPQECILETTYGFNPERLAPAIGVERPQRAPVFVFVGLGIVRKGLDVLLEAWERAGVDGTLLIAGRIHDEVRQAYQKVLARSDVREIGFQSDVATAYSLADVFVFPTHEEGGPLVIYEAAACGLASIVSPMGAGRLVRDQLEGLIVDPLDVDAVAAALTKLADDESLRQTLAKNAAERAREFSWANAGTRLYDQFCTIACP